MSPDDFLHYLLLSLLPLWLLSYFSSPTLDNLFSISMTMAKSSGLSVMDVLHGFIGFFFTQYFFKPLHQGNEVGTTSALWLTQRTSLSSNVFGNAVQGSLELRDLATRLIVYCRDLIVLLPIEKPTASSTTELSRAVLYAVMIRGSLPSMLGTFMATDLIQRWMCDLMGLVALIIALVPSLALPNATNVVSAIHLQEPCEVSLHEEKTLIQTPSPNQKKKWVILVDRLPTPRDRTPPRRSPSPIPAFPISSSEGRNKSSEVTPSSSIKPGNVSDVGNTSRVTTDNDGSSRISTPVVDRINTFSMKETDFSASPRLSFNERVGSRSFNIAERLEITVPKVIVEPASDESLPVNDTFSITDVLSCEPECNLVDEQFLADVTGDNESFFSTPEELRVDPCIPDRYLVTPEQPKSSLGHVSTFDHRLVATKREGTPTAEIIAKELAQDKSIKRQSEGAPFITVSAVNDSYGENDTFSLTDLLASVVKDDLLDMQEMRDDLANVSMAETHNLASSSGKAKDVEICTDEVPTTAEERGAPVAGPSTHPDAFIIDNPGPSSKKRGHMRHCSKDALARDIYTPYGLFSMAKMPYELFSPASMYASEVASALLTDAGRIRCADWRASVDRGQQLLRVEQLSEENDKDLAEFNRMQATLRKMMREVGLETPATPPRVPNVQITQASPDSNPEKPVLDRAQILLEAYRFPVFLENAAPLTVDIKSGSKPSLVAAESVDSMYDPDFPGLNGKQADRYPKLNSDWPADFPTEADTSDEWKLTQEMIDFWAARKAKMEAENPPPPVNIDDLSMEVDDGGENDRTFADFEDSGEYNHEDEHCLPGDSRLKCVGWRYEVVPVTPQPPKEPGEHLVETVGNAILDQMYSIYSMYGKRGPQTSEEPCSPSPPSSPPPRVPSPPSAPVAEPAPVTLKVLPADTTKKAATLRRQATSQAAPTTRVLRPRPSAPAKVTLPAQSSVAPSSASNVRSKLRPRPSIATSNASATRATTEKKALTRQSLPALKTAPRRSLAQPSAVPKVSLAPPKATPRQSLHNPAQVSRQTIASHAASIAIAKLKPTSQSQLKSKALQTQTQPQAVTGIKRVPLGPIQTNILRPSLPFTATVAIAASLKSASKLPPPRVKRMSLAPPPVQVMPEDVPKTLPPRARSSLSRLPGRRTSLVSHR